MIRFSFLNLAEAASLAASTTFTEQDTTIALRFPRRPFLRGYSPDLSNHRITLDFGTAPSLSVIALVHANFSAATVQGNASDTWGAPTYSQAVTLTPSVNDRYHHAHRPTAFAFRYLSILVSTGATTDGATRWALGGIWAGALTSPPRDIRFEPTEERSEAYAEVQTSDGRLLQRLKLDEPAVRVVATRLAETEAELAAWRTIDRQWAAAPAQAALVCLRDSYPEESHVMRMRVMAKWKHARVWSESILECSEVIAG